MRHRRQRHYLFHTLEHLLGVFVVLAVAFSLGALAKSFGAPSSGLLAQTSGDASYASTTPNGSTTTYTTVAFGVTREMISCVSGVTRAKYRFYVTPEDGGNILVHTPVGTDYIDKTNNQGFYRYYDVGVYSWQGMARLNYGGMGYGQFEVENVCTTSITGTDTSATTTSTSGTSGGASGSSGSGSDSTTSNTSGNISPTPAPATTQPIPVSFSVQPAPTATCGSMGAPLTPVFLAVTKELGGEFLISSNTGMSNAHYGWGEYNFPNGVYSWSAVVKSGYQGDGTMAGSFTISHQCPTVTTSTQTTATNASPTVTMGFIADPTAIVAPPTPPPLPRPLLSLFLDNTPVTEGRVFNKEEVEVRITTAIASKVEIFKTEGTTPPKVLARAVKDELLSRPGVDIWSYVLNMADFPEGMTKLHVRVLHADGRETVSERTSVSVKHPVLATMKTSMVTPPPVPAPASQTITGSGTMDTSVRVTSTDREAVLTRVSDPSSCGNAEECRIYCGSTIGVNELCVAYAQEEVVATVPHGESLADDVATEKLVAILSGGEEHATEIPDFVTTPEELRSYCSSTENLTLCKEVFLDHEILSRKAVDEKKDSITRAEGDRLKVLSARTGTRAYVDTDHDGVMDYDEINIYHTDPVNTDTDADGFSDGAELLARTNPSGGLRVVSSSGTPAVTVPVEVDESVLFDNPKISGLTVANVLVVKNVVTAEVGTSTNGTKTATKLKLSGLATPNSFVTLYIFSEPIVVTVKADGAGAWVYTLDKELPDGTHQVYSTITDAGGRILAKSEPLPFIKEAAAVSLGSTALTPDSSAPGFFTGASLYAMIAILVGILGIAISIIWFIVKQKNIADTESLPGL